MATALVPSKEEPPDSPLARSIWFLGGLMTFHAESASTNGQFSLVEVSGKPGGEPPMHVHQNEDELFYVLEGKLRVFRGNQELTLNAGDAACLPRNVPHTFKIVSKYARWLAYITPAGFEGYFREVGQPAERLAPKEIVESPDPAKLAHVAGKYGITFLPSAA
jgi:quercetin dioxygenase-like cupin family protein